MKQKQRIRTRKIYHAQKPAGEVERQVHCTFCGGKGPNMEVEIVEGKNLVLYRVPKSHTACKQSILSLSLFE